jgi:hypothetical protein
MGPGKPDDNTVNKEIVAGVSLVARMAANVAKQVIQLNTNIIVSSFNKGENFLTGSGDHSQKYGEPVTKTGGGADPTKNTAKITGPEIFLDDKFSFVLGLPGSSFKMPSGSLAITEITNTATQAANEIIQEVSEDEPEKTDNNSNTSSTNNKESNSNDRPDPEVVTGWGSPDSSGVYITKDSLSNGTVSYSKKNLNNQTVENSNKNTFDRAWNGW